MLGVIDLAWPMVTPRDCPPEDTAAGGLDEILNPGDALSDQYTRRDVMNRAAIEFLWNVSNRAYGTYGVRVRPCRQECKRTSPWLMTPMAGPSLQALQTSPSGWCGTCGPTGCGCTVLSTIVLPGPVAAIDAVYQDGNLVNPTSYRLIGDRLVRVDGGSWPVCQDLAADIDDVGSFVVDYHYGAAVPAGGQLAAGVLACELAKRYVGASGCQLPSRVQTITRQGVTMAMLDSFDELKEGRSGIWEVDQWISSLRQVSWPSMVWSPDMKDKPDVIPTTLSPIAGDTGGGGIPDAGDGVLVYNQTTPSNLWVITHNFGVLPASVEVLDTGGSEILASVDRTTTTVTIGHATPTAGTAIITRD